VCPSQSASLFLLGLIARFVLLAVVCSNLMILNIGDSAAAVMCNSKTQYSNVTNPDINA
jgi:hypothetical protein